MVPREHPRDRRVRARDHARRAHRPRHAAPGQAARLRRPAHRRADRPHRAADPRAARGPRHHGHLQDGGHVRRRVRGPHALSLLDVRGGGRGPAVGPPQGHHPGLGPQPDRPGHRVRLLLRPRRLRAPRAGRGSDHGQLQPRDGLDRLRHVRPAVLRAAHAGGRPQHRREGAAARRHRPVRRPDAAQARGAAARGGRAHPRDVARRHRSRRGPPALQRAHRRARSAPGRRRHRPLAGRGPDHRGHHRLPGARPPLVRAGRPGHADRPRRPGPRALHDRGGQGRARPPHPRRQVPRGRDRDRRGRRLRRRARGGRRRDGAHREGRRALRRRRLLAAALLARRRPGQSAPRPDQGAGPRRWAWSG